VITTLAERPEYSDRLDEFSDAWPDFYVEPNVWIRHDL
jgi:hypothetical protein